mmetsp:Transcript_83198/g.147298  ORF Transcript_83198/g.147298 Transcript_83198/m.147298 type:complete len:148 (+) Transcript_83198:82-525(+)
MDFSRAIASKILSKRHGEDVWDRQTTAGSAWERQTTAGSSCSESQARIDPAEPVCMQTKEVMPPVSEDFAKPQLDLDSDTFWEWHTGETLDIGDVQKDQASDACAQIPGAAKATGNTGFNSDNFWEWHTGFNSDNFWEWHTGETLDI